MESLSRRVGAVVIGRNEGERLPLCLRSIAANLSQLVYVDSGSEDGSVEAAKSLGVRVLELSRDRPFTAARARNEGCARLLELWPHVELVQFVDGDCQLHPAWPAAALAAFAEPDVAVAFGRLRERHPERSIYNRLCDIEWWQPPGEAPTCGGIALMRASALREVEGFATGLIAGEEPDLCIRLLERGWRILSLDAEMGLHDADMTRLGQWWRRAVRAGHAYAEVTWRHRRGASGFWRRNVRSNWVWGALLPLLALLLVPLSRGLSLLALSGWGALACRIYTASDRPGLRRRDRALYAASCVLGKVPAALGQARFFLGRSLQRPAALIEHKR